MTRKMVKTQKLVFYNLIDGDEPLLCFEVAGAEKSVDEAVFRIRNQVLKMQNCMWDEACPMNEVITR